MFGVAISVIASTYKKVQKAVGLNKKSSKKLISKTEPAKNAQQPIGYLSEKGKVLQQEIHTELKNKNFSPSDLICFNCNQQCQSITLRKNSIHFCDRCKSFHFPQNTLSALTGFEKDIPLEDQDCKSSTIICKLCKSEMESRLFSRKPYFMVEKCPECSMVFLPKTLLKYVLPFV